MHPAADINKRAQRRLAAHPLQRLPESKSRPYRILDISSSGCQVESRAPLGRIASLIPLELPLPARDEAPVVRAEIVWAGRAEDREENSGFRYGLFFREMGPASYRALSMYLDFLLRKHHVSRLDDAWRRIKAPQGR